MATKIRRVDYFYTTVGNGPDEAYTLLSQLAEVGVNLLAFAAVPVGPDRTQVTLFPEEDGRLSHAAPQLGLTLDGPHPALYVCGDDELGALAAIHEKLHVAGVNVFASSGVTDGQGSYGYVIYVRPKRFDEAARALGV